MDHNDEQDEVKDEGMAKTAYKTNGQRCQKPRSAIVWQKRTDGNVGDVAKSNMRRKDDGKTNGQRR